MLKHEANPVHAIKKGNIMRKNQESVLCDYEHVEQKLREA